MYMKHYYARNQSLIKDANQIWTNMHIERTNMLFSKDNYYNEMCILNQLKRKLEENDYSQGFEYKESPHRKISQQQVKTEQAETEYKCCLQNVNLIIEQFSTVYKSNLNRI